jgi:hypothetical protein
MALSPDILMMLMPPVPAGVAMAAIVESSMESAAALSETPGSIDQRPSAEKKKRALLLSEDAASQDRPASAEFLLGVILLPDRKNVVDQPVQHQAG